MRKIIILAALVGVAIVGTVRSDYAADNAETSQGTISAMVDLYTKIRGLRKENDGYATANATLIQKNKLLKEKLHKLQPSIDMHIAKTNTHVANEKRLKDLIEKHNAACPSDKPVPRPQYDRCKGEEPYLKESRINHHAEKEILKKERASLFKERDSYVTPSNNNNTQIKKNFKRHLEIKATVERNLATLKSYRSRLFDLCAKAETDRDVEALHYCVSVSWDGAKKSLPSLDEILQGSQFLISTQ